MWGLFPGTGLWRRRLSCKQGKDGRKAGRALWGARRYLCPSVQGRWCFCSVPSPCGGCLKPLRTSLKGGGHFLWDSVRPLSSSPMEEPTHEPLPEDPARAPVLELLWLEAGTYMVGVWTLNSHTSGFKFRCCHSPAVLPRASHFTSWRLFLHQ